MKEFLCRNPTKSDVILKSRADNDQLQGTTGFSYLDYKRYPAGLPGFT